MLKLQPYAGTHKLVLAFDIGTTCSGVSYCIPLPGQVPVIRGVTKFPGQGSIGDAKVPSLLYYDKLGTVRVAGAEALDENIGFDTEGWTKAEWWKLHLRPSHMASVKSDALPPLPPGKSAVDILSDFIHYLFTCTKTYIVERHPTFNWSTAEGSIQYVFTHPNGWEGLQQQQYREAIGRAGLIPQTPEGYSRVHMLTEGEASLHYCVSSIFYRDDESNRRGTVVFADTAPGLPVDDRSDRRGVVVVDAGGGTIDLSMYSVTCDPISCEEIAPAECRLQGSVFVTRRAEALLQRKLNGWEGFREGDMLDLIREFDRSTKLVIMNDKDPVFIKVAGRRYSNPRYNISFGKLRLTGPEATGLFKESIDAIIDAFEQQLTCATMPITTAFLVGGFSSNDWLWSQLQSYFERRNIEICRLEGSGNKAAADGAALAHVDLENHLVTSRVARATYGFFVNVLVDEEDEEHLRKRYTWKLNAAGEYHIPGGFESKLYKGTHVPREMEFRHWLWRPERHLRSFHTLTVRLGCYRGDLPVPKWVDEDEWSFSTLCTISADVSGDVNDLAQWDQSYYRINYEVILFFGLTELQAQIACQTTSGERRYPATVSYQVPYSQFSSFTHTEF